MNRNNLNISSIETYLDSLIRNKVSKNTFVGTLPTATQSGWKDMVLIDCGSSISDMNAYGQGIVLVWLYAKPMANGCKNVAVMSQLEKKLGDVIDKASNGHYAVERRYTYQDYDPTRQWHCNIVEIKITIV